MNPPPPPPPPLPPSSLPPPLPPEPGRSSASPGARWMGGWVLPALVGAVGLALTLWLAHHEDEEATQALRRGFDAALRDTCLRIEQRMAAHEQLLLGTRALVASQQAQNLRQAGASALDEDALRRYLQLLPLGADFAGLQGLGLVRADGDATLVMLEPALAHNRQAAGRALMQLPAARQALELARDSGHLGMSAQLDLRELGLRAGPGALLALALYGGPPPQDMLQRRAQLLGWVVAPLGVPDMMGALYGEPAEGLSVEIHDGQLPGDATRLFRRAPADPASLALARADEYLVLGGQTWTVSMRADASFAHAQGLRDARVILVGGLAVTLALAALAAVLSGGRARAHALAERMTAALRESEQRWAFALAGAGDGVWDWALREGSIRCSSRSQALMGWPRADLPVTDLFGLVHAEDVELLRHELLRCLQGRSASLSCEFRVRREGSLDWRWVLARGTVMARDDQQRPQRMTGTLSDVDARRQSEERVRFMARHDPLTELANRAHFQERMQLALANARRYNDSLGLILLDLDRFKPINDQHGHAVGDELLITLARRLRHSVRETDTVGRIGGDEFLILLTGPVTRESAQVVIDKIYNQVAMPVEIGGLRLELTCSLGLALYPVDGQDEMSLTQAADAAMYRAKRASRQLSGDGR